MTQPLLAVRKLGIQLGASPVIEGLDYELADREILGVVGESGCGKTLSALALLGLLPSAMHTTGQAWFGGRDLLTLNERELQDVRGGDIGMIFQEPLTALNPVISIGDQIAEMFILHRDLRRRAALEAAAAALERVHIGDALDCLCRYPHQLSGGQRQRVMIAMALACEPQLLIADEPTTALDVTVQDQVLELILELRRELGMAVLFISHNLGVIAQISDRVMVLYAGRVVEIVPTEDLLQQRSLHPYTRLLLTTLPRLGQRRRWLPTIPGTVPPLGSRMSGCRFANRCPLADAECLASEPLLQPVAAHHQVACYKIGTPLPTIDAARRSIHA